MHDAKPPSPAQAANITPQSRVIVSLPPHLAERCRVIREGPIGDGEFVLYWMHHSVRGHDNPALDVAIELANGRRLPVLVYQGLAGAHPYNNDRHHTFILQGARDAHRELRARGVRTAFHLDPGGDQPSPLRSLVRRAALVVAEDYPAPPFPRWTEGLARHSPNLLVAVDGCCVVPMQSQPRRFSRAFDFRRHNEAGYRRRLGEAWPELTPRVAPFAGDVDCEPLDLERADIAALCAACDIDHSVPAVAHTPGGSLAGYARWDAFKTEGLAGYAAERNDAAIEWPHGVSRLSPYLHHGHVSPLRIGREAAAMGGEGARKFLDELLTWRELAFNFCFHSNDPAALHNLPDWARQTLDAHAADPRPAIIDDETLARSGSGEELWDLAQTSLRIHGELHNNLRMTWAKAILLWRADPAQALRTLIDLNHRYALDGSDPNSYGGLLWALGLFDRPFAEQPVIGTLRSRSVCAHARRLDLARYRARVTQPSAGRRLQIAVIGAGVAGLSAARTLHDQGHAVTVFEKSRGLGGRAATRRSDDVGFDHGAQYFTARHPVFRRAVLAGCETGVIQRWPARMARVADGIVRASPDAQERFVAVPGMSALGRHLAHDLDVRHQVRVAAPHYQDRQWTLRDDGGALLGDYDALVLSAPAPQAAELLRPQAPALAEIAAGVAYEPMWAVMLHLTGDDTLGCDGLFVGNRVLSWAARNSSKPGRHGSTWVVHADARWTRDHLDAEPRWVAEQLGRALAEVAGLQSTALVTVGAHRWLYALVPEPLDVGALWDPELQLAVCGDWCQGARIEGAYLSGVAAAGRLLGHLAQQAGAGADRRPISVAQSRPG